MAADNKVVTSAVVVSLPKDLWGPIQAIREKHDKVFKFGVLTNDNPRLTNVGCHT